MSRRRPGNSHYWIFQLPKHLAIEHFMLCDSSSAADTFMHLYSTFDNMQTIIFSNIHVNNKSSLVKVAACRLIGNTPLPEPMMTQMHCMHACMHICISRLQCVNNVTTTYVLIDAYHEVGDQILVSGIKNQQTCLVYHDRCKTFRTRMVTRWPFIQAQIKENIKAPLHWPLWREFTSDRWIPRTKSQ